MTQSTATEINELVEQPQKTVRTTSKVEQKRTKSYRQNLKAFHVCRSHWPEVFSLKNPQPLMIGIRQRLIEDAVKRKIPNLSNGKIYNALYWLTATSEYQLAVMKSKPRIDINGNPVSTVTPREKSAAIESLKNLSPPAIKWMDRKRKVKPHQSK